MIDSIQFARKAGRVSFTVPLAKCPRLVEETSEQPGELRVRLEGFVDAGNKPCLRLQVEGTISLVCQRCLEPLESDIASDRMFLLKQREDDLGELADEAVEIETMLASSQLDVREFAEDEVLLQIPIAPMHDEGKCEAPRWSGERDKAHGAFAELDELRKTNPK